MRTFLSPFPSRNGEFFCELAAANVNCFAQSVVYLISRLRIR
jgi:hypothetical protein